MTTICPRSHEQNYVVTYYKKFTKTSLTCNKSCKDLDLHLESKSKSLYYNYLLKKVGKYVQRAVGYFPKCIFPQMIISQTDNFPNG